MKKFKGYLCGILAAVGFGASPLLASFIYAYGTSPSALGFLRVFCLVPIFGIVAIIHKDSFKLTWTHLGIITILALTGGVATTLLIYEAYTCLDGGTVTTLNFTYPIFVLLIGIILFKDKVSKTVLVSFALCVVGILLFCNPSGNFTWRGFFMALASGVMYAVYVTLMDKTAILDKMGFYAFTFYFFMLSSVLYLPLALKSGGLSLRLPFGEWMYVLLFALVCGVLATVCFQVSVREIGGKKSSILAAMEPVTSLVAGALFMEQPITIMNALGIVFVVASTLVLVLNQSDEMVEKANETDT